MSGAGGGGFIGIRWMGPVLSPTTLALTVNVAGGRMTDECSGFFPTDFNELVYGHEGIKAALEPCAPGHFGKAEL